ncbi:MAG: class I SAM-dependent methyltransferase [Candidatus Methanomethylophilaceae archaeon]|nr:class I SAM-dependent methyltransferase [Candidatus Methanomethylophilaceae archaeon]
MAGQKDAWDGFYVRNGRAWGGNTPLPECVSGDVLDLGCGNGKTVSSLLGRGCKVTGVDFSGVAIEMCRERFPDCAFVCCDARSLPFADSSFDWVTAVHVLENLDGDQLSETAKEIGRVLRPGGSVFIRMFTANDFRSSKRESQQICYTFHDGPSIENAFDGFLVVSHLVDEKTTRFGALRSVREIILRKST